MPRLSSKARERVEGEVEVKMTLQALDSEWKEGLEKEGWKCTTLEGGRVRCERAFKLKMAIEEIEQWRGSAR